MQILVHTYEELDELFGGNEEGQDQVATQKAIDLVHAHLGEGSITWHLPDVFDVRYGSHYVATATVGTESIRFISPEGTWQDGDDQ